ncbi:MAG: hypothetical protein U1D30_09845 [Planctomycetota bacterium]
MAYNIFQRGDFGVILKIEVRSNRFPYCPSDCWRFEGIAAADWIVQCDVTLKLTISQGTFVIKGGSEYSCRGLKCLRDDLHRLEAGDLTTMDLFCIQGALSIELLNVATFGKRFAVDGTCEFPRAGWEEDRIEQLRNDDSIAGLSLRFAFPILDSVPRRLHESLSRLLQIIDERAADHQG